MECCVAALVSDAKEQPSWQAAFSDREVNGWLAIALKEKFADLLPPSILDPRVAFEAEEAVIGFRYQDKDFTTVISVRVNAWLSDPDVVAIRLLKAHVGTLPIPLTKIVDQMTQALQKQVDRGNLTQEQADDIVEKRSESMGPWMYLQPVIGMPLMRLIGALILLFIGNVLFGGSKRFAHYWSLALYGGVIAALGAIIMGVLVAIKGDIQGAQLGLGILTAGNPQSTIRIIISPWLFRVLSLLVAPMWAKVACLTGSLESVWP